MKKILVLFIFLSPPVFACKMTPIAAQSGAINAIITSLEGMSSQPLKSIESIHFISQMKARVSYTAYNPQTQKTELKKGVFTVGTNSICHFSVQSVE